MGVPVVLLSASYDIGKKVAEFVEPEFTVLHQFIDIVSLLDGLAMVGEMGVKAIFIGILYTQEEQDRVEADVAAYDWASVRNGTSKSVTAPLVIKTRPLIHSITKKYQHIPFEQRGPHVAKDRLLCSGLLPTGVWQPPLSWSEPTTPPPLPETEIIRIVHCRDEDDTVSIVSTGSRSSFSTAPGSDSASLFFTNEIRRGSSESLQRLWPFTKPKKHRHSIAAGAPAAYA